MTGAAPATGRVADRLSSRLGRTLAAAIGLVSAVLVLVRLGPSLIGARVFLGLDLFDRFTPWSSAPGANPSSRSSIYVSDHLDFFIPGMHEIATRFWHGDLAGWSNYVGGGSSLLGTPIYGVISPGRWLYLVMPAWLAPGWSKLAEMAFAAVFSYLLVRRLRGSRVAGALAGFIYPMTGFMIAWTNWPQVAVACVIPMMFFAIERFVQERRWATLVPVSLASALLLFGGFPAVAGQTFYLAGGYALVRVIARHWRDDTAAHRLVGAIRDIFALALAAALGVGLTAFQLLPFVRQFLQEVDLSYRDSGFFSDSPKHYLLSTTFPKSFAGNNLWTGASPMDINTYLGAAVVALGVLGAVAVATGRLRREAGVYFALMIMFVIGLTYFQGAWSDWMGHLPIFKGNPIGRLRSQLGLPVAVLAAAGFDGLRGHDWDTGWVRRRLAGWNLVTVGLLVLVTALVGTAGELFLHRHYKTQSTDLIGKDVLIAVLPLVVVTLLAVFALRWYWARALALLVLVLSVGGQALAATQFYWPTGSRSQFYPSFGVTRYLQTNTGHDRIGTLGYTMRPNVTAYYGIRTVTGHGFFPKPMKQLLLAIDPSSFQGGPTYSLLTPMLSKVYNMPGLDRLGVRYLAGDIDSVIPGTLYTPQPLLGTSDPLPVDPGAALPLTPGTGYTTTIAAGPLRGVTVPMVTTAARTTVTAVVTRPDGSVVASDSRHIAAGNWQVPVPLAAETPSPAPAAGEHWQVQIKVDQPGVTARAYGTGVVQLSAVRPDPATSSIRLVYAGDSIQVWQRLNYVPRIHWASQAAVITDDQTRLKAAAQSPVQPNQVILASNPSGPLDSSAGQPSSFNIDEDSADTIRVHETSSAPGYLVVADNVQSDFAAFVDGRPAPIVAADYAVGAVYIPAGSHQITYRYSPKGRKTGTAITGLSALTLVLIGLPPVWWSRVRRARPRRRKADRG
ncbi:MAG TPA: YfhO family protein [Jatrophihabitans sp.]|nr:YfhO family protein [Jatrophihabitans sp.]